MTCLTGYFGYLNPQSGPEPSLAEALIKADGKGAIAALMPTAMTSTSGQHILDVALFEAIFTKDIRQLGPAIADAKQTLLANGGAEYEEISQNLCTLRRSGPGPADRRFRINPQKSRFNAPEQVL